MAIPVTSKYEDPIKIEGDRVATTLNIDFSNTQGQITPRSEVGSGRNSNSFEMLQMSLILFRIKNKNEGARVATTLNIDFFTQSRADNCSQGLNLAEIRTHPRCYGYPCYF